MKNRVLFISSVVIFVLLFTSACALGTGAISQVLNKSALAQGTPTAVVIDPPAAAATQAAPATAPSASSNATQGTVNSAEVAALQGTLQQLYEQVNPSVVNVHVITGSSQGSTGQNGNLPFGLPQQQFGEALGSGFVWDQQGNIVTNNHVVENATSIDVIFSDGLTVPAKVVGTDVNSDLAVIKVDVPAERLKPVTLADSTQVKVGMLAIAIGNPFGLQGSMSVGIVSGLGRTLDVNSGSSTVTSQSTGSYTIPDIIQTDAPINPGNSGGVLINDEGHVMGVTAAIESSTNSSAGIGFVIPSVIVNRVVPALIKDSSYQSPWLGLSGTTMRPEIASQMNLNSDQRGAMVVSVTQGSPAEKAGLKGSTKQVTINGTQTVVGGDVIVSVDGNPVKTFEDLVTYLARYGSVGKKIDMSVLRDGKVTSLEITPEARPNTSPSASIPETPQQTQPNNPTAQGAWLGISGVTLDAAVNQAMNLPTDQQGVLVAQVQSGSPADHAGIRGGDQQATVNGQTIAIGGDVITAIDGKAITSVTDLRSDLRQANPGDKTTFTILRNGKETQVEVTLGSQTSNQ